MSKLNTNLPLSTILSLTLIISASGCSEEDRNALGAISDIAESIEAMEEAAPSTYTDNCVEPLSGKNG